MLIGYSNFMDCTSLCEATMLLEPNLNREASDYIMDNYQSLLMVIRAEGIKDEKAYDLLHDVYLSIYEAEDNGEGFDPNYGDGVMDVSNFVKGRVRRYASNKKYRTDIMETVTDTIIETEVIESIATDIQGRPIKRKGKNKTVREVVKRKREITVNVYQASFGGMDEEDKNDSFQTAYAMASVSDSTDDIAEALSLREQIDTCIDICEMHKFNILNVFKHMDLLASMLATGSRKKSADSVFSKLSTLVKEHDELADSLMSVLQFSSKHREIFDAVIATY